jgi:hypothetical protein
MKRFIVSTLVVSLAFIGAGAVVDKIIAGSKSDEKALDIIAKARTAIGGDAAIGSVKAFVIKGQTSKTVSINGAEKFEQGETEIVFESPNRLMKMVKIGDANAAGEAHKQFDVVVVGTGDGPHKVTFEGKDGEFVTDDGKKVIVRKAEGPAAEGETKVFVRRSADGGEWTPKEGESKVIVRKKADGGEWTTEDGDVKEIATSDGKTFTVVTKGGDGNTTFTTKEGDKIVLRDKVAAHGHGPSRDNELLRTMLSLFVTAPEGMDVVYKYAGSTSLDGISAEAVVASFGGADVKLFFDASTYLPLGMSYVGHAPVIIKMRKSDDGSASVEKDVMTFQRKLGGPEAGVEHLVRYADFRSVNGLMLPYKWTTTVGGKQSDVFDVSSYDLNPANISERFKGGEVKIRMKKPAEK